MAELFTVENLIALIALTSLEIVLGIDNIVFITIQSSKLPVEQQSTARRVGLLLAMGMRILLLLMIGWIMSLKTELFTAMGHAFSGRDLILLGGGLFLIWKSTMEIHEKLEHHEKKKARAEGGHTLTSVIIQIGMLDIVFSLDSVITAVGMAQHIEIMILAIVIAVLVMLMSVNGISNFVDRHPTIKMLALSFLLMIGVMLTAEGLGRHIEKGYIYFAMAFSLIVEVLNIRAGRHSDSEADGAHEDSTQEAAGEAAQ